MKTNFIAALLSTAAVVVQGQMDFDCFVMSELQGSPRRTNPIQSDLPDLIGGFDPDFEASFITVYQTEFALDGEGNYNNRLDAISLGRRNTRTQATTSGELIGTPASSSRVETFDLGLPLDSIDFLYNKYGVCNLKFNDDPQIYAELYGYVDDGTFKEGFDEVDGDYSPYAVFNDYCQEGEAGVQVMTIYMDDLLPLVGLRGKKDVRGPGISSLGFVWYNSEDQQCWNTMESDLTMAAADGTFTAEDAEILNNPDKIKKDSIYTSILVEYYDDGKSDSFFEKMISGYDTYDAVVNESRNVLLDQIQTETNALQNGESVNNDELYDLIENLLLHEQMAEIERNKIEDKQQDFLDHWDSFEDEFNMQRVAEQSVKDELYDMEIIGEDSNDTIISMLVDVLEMKEQDSLTMEDVAQYTEKIMAERSENTVTADQFQHQIWKIMLISLFTVFVGMLIGFFGYYVIQRVYSPKKSTSTEAKKPEQTFHAVDVVSARGPNPDKAGHLAVPQTTSADRVESEVEKNDLEQFKQQDDIKTTDLK